MTVELAPPNTPPLVNELPPLLTIAVVGGGFGSLMVFTTAVYLGFRPGELGVFGDTGTPVTTYGRLAANLGQTVLRSESESHFLPADWPTFAQLDAWSRRSVAPVARSIRRRYNPGLRDILTEAALVGAELGWNDARVEARIARLERVLEPTPHFVLYNEAGSLIARARHVMLALGRGPLAFPPLLARARQDPELAPRIIHVYEDKAYESGRRYLILGAGIAAGNACSNALAAGADVIALRRRPLPDVQDLNVPRCMFEARGIDAFQRLPFEQRVDVLEAVLRGTSPVRRTWNTLVAEGVGARRYQDLIGEIDAVQRRNDSVRLHVARASGNDPGWLEVDAVVCATGFTRSALTHPLLRRLVHEYDLPVEHGRLKLLGNCGVPTLDRDDSRLCVMGLIANTVIPHADTIAGLKYIARRFVADCARAERPRRRGLASRVRLQLSLAHKTSKALRGLEPVKQEG